GPAHSPRRAGHQRDGVLHAVHRAPPEDRVSTAPTRGSPTAVSALVFPVSGHSRGELPATGNRPCADGPPAATVGPHTGSVIEEDTSDDGSTGGDAAGGRGDRGDRRRALARLRRARRGRRPFRLPPRPVPHPAHPQRAARTG